MKTTVITLAIVALAFGCEKKDPESKSKKTAPGKTTKPGATKVKAKPVARLKAEPKVKLPPLSDALKDPSLSTAKAPDKFKAKFVTTKGEFVIEVTRAWSPNGADRFYNLINIGYFKDIALFRVVKGFMAQFGIHGDPRIASTWLQANIPDDKVVKSNTRGMVTYAKSGRPNSRSVQLFINYTDRNAQLDAQGFSPFGKIVKGMDVVDSFYNGYGGRTTRQQGTIAARGNDFLKENYPKLDYIKSASIVK